MANTVELLRRIIRQHTNNIGETVSNLYGAVASPVEGLEGEVISTWAKATIPGAVLIELNDFYALWASTEPRNTTILSSSGGAVLSVEPDTRLQLLRGVLTASSALSVPLTVDVGSSAGEFAIYVDSVLQRRGSGTLTLPLTFDSGPHLIEILALAQNLVVAVPPNIKVVGTTDAPERPRWDLVKSGWLDAKIGTPATELRWTIDRRAGGWRILRRKLEFLSRILSVGELDNGGVFGVILAGNASLSIGDELHAMQQTLGVVTSVLYDSVLNETSVTVRLNPELSAPRRSWVGARATKGIFIELRRVKRVASSGQIVQYDPDVITGESYEYCLQAYGLFDESQVSPLSAAAYVRAGDLDAPGPISFLEGYPKVSRGRATVRYRTPSDDDYAGTKVEYRERYTAIITGASTTGVTFGSDLLIEATYEAGFKALVMAVPGGDTSALNQMVEVTAFPDFNEVATETWEVVPPIGSTVMIFKDRPIITDTGVAGVEDEMTFEVSNYGEGEYIFRTFDFGGNTQDDRNAVLWEYDSTIDEDGLSFGITVREITSETLSVGTLTLEVGDPDDRITLVEMRAKEGNKAWGPWTPVTGAALVPPKLHTKNYIFTVPLTDKAPSAIAYRIQAEDDKGAIDYVIEAVVPFSLGTKPGLPTIVISFTSAGKALVTLSGDSDTKNYKIAHSTIAQPTLSETQAATATTNNSRNYSVLLPTAYAPGTTVYFSVLALSEDGEESDLLTTRASRDGSNDIAVQEITSETATTGTLTLVIPNMTRVTKVEMRSQKAREDWGPWTDVTSSLTMTVALEEKTTSFIAWRITGYDSVGGLGFLEESIVPFRVGSKPMIPTVIGSFDALGRLVLTFAGDSDTDYYKWEASSSGQPSAASVRLQSPTSSGRIVTDTSVDRFEISEVVYVSAFAYNEVDGPDIESEILTARFAREGLEEVRVEERATETATSGTLTLEITDPQSRVTKIEMRTKVGNEDWSAWADKTTTKFITVALVEAKISLIAYRITGSDSTGNTLVLKESIVPFTSGNIPGVPQIDVSFNAIGNAIIILTGDSDTDHFKYSMSTVDFPSDAVTAAETNTTLATRVYTTTTASEFAIGELVYVTAIAYSTSGQRSVMAKGIFARQGLSDIMVQEVPTETATTGSLSLIIRDPGVRITLVEMRSRSGSGAWTVYDEVTGGALSGGTRTYTVDTPVTLVEGKSSAISYRITGYDATGDVAVLKESVVAFNAGVIPGIPEVTVGFTADGKVEVVVDGDSDTLSARCLVTSAAQANDTALLATTPSNGRQTVFTPATPVIAAGSVAYVTVYAYSQANGGGQRSPLKSVSITMPATSDTIALQCELNLSARNTTTVSAVVNATDPAGGTAPTYAIVSATGVPGGVNAVTGAGTVLSPYVVPRPALGSGPGELVVTATKTGRVSDSDSIFIPEKGTDAVNLHTVVTQTGGTSSTVVVTVSVTDPLGTAIPTLIISDATGIPGGAAAITGSNPYTIPRPTFGSAPGRVVFTASADGRLADSDSVDVPPIQQDTNTEYTQCFAQITSIDAEKVSITVTGSPSGSQVEFVEVQGSGTVTKLSGLAAGVKGSSPQVYQFSRGTFAQPFPYGGAGTIYLDSGDAQVRFRATKNGLISDEDFVWIPQKAQDSIPLTMLATVTAVTSSDITVRVKLMDPKPQTSIANAYKITPSISQGATGLAVYPNTAQVVTSSGVTNDINTTGYATFTITRPDIGENTGRVVFVGSIDLNTAAQDRLVDVDAVDVPAKDKNGPSITITPTGSANAIQLAWVAGTNTTVTITSSNTVLTYTSPATATSTSGTLSAARPAAGNGPGTVTFTISRDGTTDTRNITIPSFEPRGPSLVVTPTPGASSYSIAWSGDGVTLSIDGAAYSAPPASPITVTRNAVGGADKLYSFKGTLNNETVVDSVTIPAKGAKDTPDLSVVPGAMTTTTIPFTVTFSAPGGSTATGAVYLSDCTATVGGNPFNSGSSVTSGTVITANRPEFSSLVAGTVRVVATVSGGGTEEISRSVQPQAKTSFGPSLQIRVDSGSGGYDGAWGIYWDDQSSGSTVEVNKNALGWTAPGGVNGGAPWVIERPSPGSADDTYVFRATKDGQMITNTVLIPAIGKTAPYLDFTSVTEYDDSVSVSWTGTGSTVQVKVNGGAYGPPSQPHVEYRNAAGGAAKNLTFRTLRDGVYLTNTVIVNPMIRPVLKGVSITYSAGTFTVNWSLSNAPSDSIVDVVYLANGAVISTQSSIAATGLTTSLSTSQSDGTSLQAIVTFKYANGVSIDQISSRVLTVGSTGAGTQQPY